MSTDISPAIDEDDPRWCPHFADGTPTDLCSKCNGREKAEAKIEHVGRSFTATYPGHVSCGHFVKVGETITALTSSEGERWVCEGCAV